jgi:LPS-assembly protein
LWGRLTLVPRQLCAIYFFITITLMVVGHPQVWAQEVTSQAPPGAAVAGSLPDEPGVSSSAGKYPVAEVLPDAEKTTPVTIESAQQSRVGNKYFLDGDVLVTYGDRTVQADHIEYDTETGEMIGTGHLKVTGGKNHEVINASHGTLNTKVQTGRFYDVTGSVGVKQTGANRMVYVNTNPFLFSGRIVVKTGPQEYEVYDGTVTSCQLPDPDWQLYSKKFVIGEEKAVGTNSVFRLLNVPLVFMPYVTHPVDATDRQSGLLIPTPGYSNTKGITFGDEYYWAINRSMDAELGLYYYSIRGWREAGTFRYRGFGNNFALARFSALQDRGIVTGGTYVNQGGQDVVFSGRHDFSDETRVATDLEYLSSYPFREAFTENFNQAVSTDILSIGYATHEENGYAMAARVDRYQGLKRVPEVNVAGEDEKIFHVPSIDFGMTEHEIGDTGVQWVVGSTAAGLKRVEPFFQTSGIVERFDLHPQISYPLSGGGWHFNPTIGLRDTFYTRSRVTPYPPGPTVESPNSLNRSDVEATVEIRPPVIERTFTSGWLRNLLRRDVRHTIEPEFTYRYVAGIGNFLSVLRFDETDIASDTTELEYGVTQRLFLRPGKAGPCKTPSAEEEAEAERIKDDGDVPTVVRCGSREFISWRLTQKHFFDENFGGAVIDGRRNIFTTTLDLSGIAFLTEPRAISPLISRLRVRASSKVDVEWDFDLDTGAKKFTSDNVLVDVHQGNMFGGLSYARLNAPGRSYSEEITTVVNGIEVEGTSATSDFSQLRLLMGYGAPTKRGLAVAANVGLDLNLGQVQYGAAQVSYNWDCCGLSFEYRKYELGSVRNENAYRFNFTLVNIGTAGNLRRAERLF